MLTNPSGWVYSKVMTNSRLFRLALMSFASATAVVLTVFGCARLQSADATNSFEACFVQVQDVMWCAEHEPADISSIDFTRLTWHRHGFDRNLPAEAK